MAMTRFDPREKFADRLWTREQVLHWFTEDTLPGRGSGPYHVNFGRDWFRITDAIAGAAMTHRFKPGPIIGGRDVQADDLQKLSRAMNAMPIEPGCESPFGRPENVNHKRQGYDHRQWSPEEIAMAKTAPPDPSASPIPGMWERRRKIQDSINAEKKAALQRLLAEPPRPLKFENSGMARYIDEGISEEMLRPDGPPVPMQSDEHVDLSQYLDIPTEQSEVLVVIEVNGNPHEFKMPYQPSGAELRAMRAAIMLDEAKADKLVWPFPPYQPKQAGEDWEIWSKRRNGFIRVGRDAPRKEGANPVHAPPDDLKYWPKCAQCDKPADFYEMEAQDMGALRYAYKIRVHHHGKVHVIEKIAGEIACLRGPLEAFTDGWDK